jgi:hypothetical protein
MVNFGLNSASILGLFDIILAVVYFVLPIIFVVQKNNIIGTGGVLFYVIQAKIAPFVLLLTGMILLFQGWRLDPILQFAMLLQQLLIIYNVLKDIYIFNVINSKLGKTRK